METAQPQDLAQINKKIQEETNKLFKLMGIEKDDARIALTYRAKDGARPKIV